MSFEYVHDHSSKLTPEQGQEIINRYVSGESTPQLAKAFEVCPSVIQRALKRSGVPFRMPKNKYEFTEVEELQIVEYYNAGWSARNIGEVYGVGHGPIMRVLKNRGVPLRDKTIKSPRGSKKLSEVTKERWSNGDFANRQPHPQTQETREKIREANTGANHYNWKDGRCQTSRGYLLVKTPNDYQLREDEEKKPKYIFEHRFVMEQHLGRRLESEEIVHHKNGIKNDNRLENLALMTFANHHGEVTCPHCQKEFHIK